MEVFKKPKQEIIKDLIEIANNFDPSKENYLISYPHFLNYFQNIETINLEAIIIGISFAYSWMPTILKHLDTKDEDKLVLILNEVKNGKQLDDSELLILKKAFNNSLVGTSKLLHFINPEKYAIWDSRVFKYLNNGEEPHKYKLEKPEIYIEYLKFIDCLKNESDFHDFYQVMKQKSHFLITENRALELAFFKGLGI